VIDQSTASTKPAPMPRKTDRRPSQPSKIPISPDSRTSPPPSPPLATAMARWKHRQPPYVECDEPRYPRRQDHAEDDGEDVDPVKFA